MERTAGVAIESGSTASGGVFHRVVEYLGSALFGIGAGRRAEPEKWWEKDATPAEQPDRKPLAFGQQGVLTGFGDRELAGVPAAAADRPAGRGNRALVVPGAAAAPAAETTLVSSVSSTAAARPVATTKRVAAVHAAAPAVSAVREEGAIARQLLLSQSLYFSSGREEPRRYSVPRRALLPRFQLFAGGDGVVSDGRGHFTLPRRDLKSQRGQVWFV